MLFPNRIRNYSGPSYHGELSFDYLQRSYRVESKNIREILEIWFSRYPSKHQKELEGKIKSQDERQFRSAIFELYLHEILKRLGYSAKPHPELKGCKKRPDFLIEDQAGRSYYFEAALVTDESDEIANANKRNNVILDGLNELESKDFIGVLTTRSNPATPPSIKKLKNNINIWLNSLDVERVRQTIKDEEYDSCPQFPCNEYGLDSIIKVYPRSSNNPKNHDFRFINGRINVEWLKTWRSMRDKIIKKGKSYRNLDHPLILALNVSHNSDDLSDEIMSLFGQEKYIYDNYSLLGEPMPDREKSGAWNGPNHSQNQKVNGVLFFWNVIPGTFSEKNTTLYHNPFLPNEIKGAICGFNQAKIMNGEIKRIEGIHPREILGLPNGWPSENV